MSADKKMTFSRIPRWKIILYFLFHLLFIPTLGTGLIFAHDMVTRSKTFELKKISLKGNEKLKKKEILKIADLNTNENLIKLNLRIIQAKLLNHPWIKTVDVKREFPNSLVIAVKEQKPVAKIKLNTLFLMNKNGKIFKKAEKKDPKLNIPEINGLNFIDLEEKNFYLQSVIEILNLEKNSKKLLYPYNFSKIQVDRDTGICIYNTNICKRLIMGFNDFEYKYEKLKLLTLYLHKKFPGQQLDKIDLSKKNRVVIKPFPAMG